MSDRLKSRVVHNVFAFFTFVSPGCCVYRLFSFGNEEDLFFSRGSRKILTQDCIDPMNNPQNFLASLIHEKSVVAFLLQTFMTLLLEFLQFSVIHPRFHIFPIFTRFFLFLSKIFSFHKICDLFFFTQNYIVARPRNVFTRQRSKQN